MIKKLFIKKIQNYHQEKVRAKTSKMVGEKNYKTISQKTINILFLTIMAVIVMFPFYWMIVTSLKTDQELANGDIFTWIPTDWTFDHYKNLLGNKDLQIWRFFVNSFLVSFLSTIIKLVICSVAAFGLAFYNSRLREAFFVIMLATMMIPGEALIIGQLIFVLKIHWDESLIALIIPYAVSVFTIYMLRQAFESIPKSVYNTARIDGASNVKIFFTISLPLIKSTLWKAGLISFIGNWNSVLWPIIVLDSSESPFATIPIFLWQLSRSTGTDSIIGGVSTLPDPQNIKMAGAMITSLPMILLYVVARKQIIKGIVKDDGVKG